MAAGHHHDPVDVDPKDLERAQTMWANFVQGGTYATVATIIILVGLALGYVKFF